MQATTVTYPPQPWYRSLKLYIGAFAVIILSQVLAAMTAMPSVLAWVLATQIVFFVLLFDRPVWAMAALLVGQLTSSNAMIILGGTMVSVRFLWTVLAILLLLPVLLLRGKINLGSRARRVMIPTALFFILATIANAVNLDLTSTYQYLRMGLTALAIIFFMPAVVKNEKDLRLLTIVVLVTCVLSALVAVMQHYRQLGLPLLTITGDMSVMPRGRAAGLTEGPINLAYVLPVAILPVFALLVTGGVSRRAKVLLLLLAVVMVIGLYFSFTRSGMYSLAPGLLAMVLLLKGRLRKVLLIISGMLIIGFLLYVNFFAQSRYAQGFGEESSAAGRLVLWQAGAMIALDHPVFGIGQGRFTQYSELYSSRVEESEVVAKEMVLGVEEAHNDFIRVWVSFGTLALVTYLWVFISAFGNYVHAYRRSKSRFVRGIALGSFAALMAYIVNSFTHNIMDSVSIFWVLVGLSAAVVKLAEMKKKAPGDASSARMGTGLPPAPVPPREGDITR